VLDDRHAAALVLVHLSAVIGSVRSRIGSGLFAVASHVALEVAELGLLSRLRWGRLDLDSRGGRRWRGR
jgi:hypothetical protein